jgi:hypothetical protein
MYEYTNKLKFNNLPDEAKLFVAKSIMRDVQKLAKEQGISEELAYEIYAKGLYDTDYVLK